MQKQLFKTTLLFAFFTGLLVFSSHLQAQNYTQTLKGVVLDKALKSPLIGATVALISVDPIRGIATDADGRFRIPNVPVGKHTLRITYLGYKDFTVPNITLNSGKETDVSIEMEESVFESKEVVIKAKVQKQKALNELSVVSARTFSVEETQRFAAAVNDPARMASSFAGVAMNDDGNNTIVIRGNAPNGYGEHAQLQTLGVYFTKLEENGAIISPNQDLGFTKARHFVLSFDQSLPGNWHIKPELYYQAIRQAPVNASEKDPFSVLNVEDGFVNKKLVNQGRGENYGVELTVEKFLTRGFYIMASAALFEAKYQGSDKVWRDGRFNTKFVNSLVAGTTTTKPNR